MFLDMLLKVIELKIRLGYACISRTLENITSSHSYTYTRFKEEENYEKLDQIIRKNFEDLEKLIEYNHKNEIHFFRMSPKVIPLATKVEVDFEYIAPYREMMENIGRKIKEYKMRVDLHPDQFCVLNSVKQDVIESTMRILHYNYELLDSLKIQDKVIILHVGGNAFGKDKSLSRFANQFMKLPKEVRDAIVVENDDKIFNIIDCLDLSKKIGVPVVLDYHHYRCNRGDIELENYIDQIFDTWQGRVPKVHFSSPKNATKKDFRSHHEYIDVDEFINFIEMMKKKNRDFDIMIEAKAKDEALFRLVRLLKWKTDYRFIDGTTFTV